MKTRFEWDADKARSNLCKHGIDFETATLAFEDPFLVIEQNRIEDGEYRWLTLGRVSGSLLLAVAHTVHESDIETIRIISARRAERRERKHYERQFD